MQEAPNAAIFCRVGIAHHVGQSPTYELVAGLVKLLENAGNDKTLSRPTVMSGFYHREQR